MKNNDAQKLNNSRIAGLRKEWDEFKSYAGEAQPAGDEVIFDAVDGKVGVGDYVYTVSDVCSRLALSEEAVARLISGGDIDSVTLRTADGKTQKMISKSSLSRFEEDSLIDTSVTEKAAAMLENTHSDESLEQLKEQIEQLKIAQTKMIQQMKDMLLLEMRNLKEQERDLSSYVYELSEEVKSRKRKLW